MNVVWLIWHSPQTYKLHMPRKPVCFNIYAWVWRNEQGSNLQCLSAHLFSKQTDYQLSHHSVCCGLSRTHNQYCHFFQSVDNPLLIGIELNISRTMLLLSEPLALTTAHSFSWFLAEEKRFELLQKGLEAFVLPLHYSPIIWSSSY